jgi:hypothetical protein
MIATFPVVLDSISLRGAESTAASQPGSKHNTSHIEAGTAVASHVEALAELSALLATTANFLAMHQKSTAGIPPIPCLSFAPQIPDDLQPPRPSLTERSTNTHGIYRPSRSFETVPSIPDHSAGA